MMLFFIGFLLVFLDFTINLPYGGVLNVLPDFLGYAILIPAFFRLQKENAHFCRASLATYIAGGLTLIEFSLNLAKVTLPKPAELAFSILLTLAALYVSYEFTEGAKQLAQTKYKKVDTDKLSSAWIILCLSSLLEYLAIYLPEVALPCYVVHWIALVWFEVAVFRFERALGKLKI